jgi:DNA-binding LacI/PurR family transcriptional regulator
VDGVLVEASMGEEGVRLLVDAGYPVTVIGHTALDVPSVRPDDESGAYVAMQHLLALGHRRIAVVEGGAGDALAARARTDGCERALADAGSALDRELTASGDGSPESGRAAAERLLAHPRPPTAFCCLDDGTAVGVLRLLRERGVDVPGEVSVTGFCDTPPAPLLTPPLTSVRVFSADQGERAARTLIGILRGMTPPGGPVVLPSQLVVRGSTAPVRRA